MSLFAGYYHNGKSVFMINTWINEYMNKWINYYESVFPFVLLFQPGNELSLSPKQWYDHKKKEVRTSSKWYDRGVKPFLFSK